MLSVVLMSLIQKPEHLANGDYNLKEKNKMLNYIKGCAPTAKNKARKNSNLTHPKPGIFKSH